MVRNRILGSYRDLCAWHSTMAEEWDEDDVEIEGMAQANDDRQHLVQRQ